jgi:peptidoglycan/LPS O-acetylase OafA/YrhL
VPGGGLVGVILFFVLSGFLITSLIVAEIERTSRLDLAAFYVRRGRRLLPPLLVVVALLMVVEAAAGTLPSTAGNDLLALSYLGNWARVAGDPMGLRNHTWSLAIEEQFYLVWPAMFLVALRFGGPTSRGLLVVVVGAAVASALLRVVLVAGGAGGDRLYFGSDTRAEAILLGSAIAIARSRGLVPAMRSWMGPAAIAALALVVIAGPGPFEPWAGASYTLVAVVAGAAIVASLGKAPLERLIASRPLTWLGDRSYSLYLWHVPVIMVFGALAPGDAAVVPRMGAALVTSLALSALSYRLIERRCRARRAVPAETGRAAPTLAPVRELPLNPA